MSAAVSLRGSRGGKSQQAGVLQLFLLSAACLLCAEGSPPTDCTNADVGSREAGRWGVLQLTAQILLQGGRRIFSSLSLQCLFPLSDSGCQTFIRDGCRKWWAKVCLGELLPEPFASTFERSWAGRQKRVETRVFPGWSHWLLLSTEGEPGPPSSSRSGNAHRPAGQFPASRHQMDRTSHFYKHAFLPLINRKQ